MILEVLLGWEAQFIRQRHKMISKDLENRNVFENVQVKLVWDFEFNLRDIILEDKEKKNICICGMTHP